MKNNKKWFILGVAILFLILTIFLISAVNVGNAVVVSKQKNTAKLVGVIITNPNENGLSFYYGTPINFTAKPIFKDQYNNQELPRYLCKWTLTTIGDNSTAQILNPEPIINNCSIMVIPGQNGIIYDSHMKITVEAKTIINNVETIKIDSRLFNLVANPTPPNNNSLESIK